MLAEKMQPGRMQGMALYLIILLEGFVTISLEILTMRQLMPIVGNNVIITSLIIGIFLLFLAYGYRKGGQYVGNYARILQKNFSLAALGLGLGLSYTFIELFFSYIRIVVPQATMILPLILYLLFIIAPIVYVLGQTVPITLNLWKKQQSLSATSGQILHISTIGSFLGATLTALILLNYFGVAWSIVTNFAILVFLIFLLMDMKTQKIQLTILIMLGWVVGLMNVGFEKTNFVATNNYGNYQVINLVTKNKEESQKYLVINDSHSSTLNAKNQGYAYIEYVKAILFNDMNIKNKNILVLGAGGFTLSAEKTNDNHFVYVDIDKQIYPIVKGYFLSKINGDFVADDAKHFLNTNKKEYDVIFSDICNNRHTIPAHLVTREYFQAVKQALASHGIAIFNILGNPILDDPYSKHMDNTIRSVFANCTASPIHIYSDDLNRSTLEHRYS
jgi:spermidine synthase